MKLVDPTKGYALATAPYGTTLTLNGTPTGLQISDFTYNAASGLLYSVIDPVNNGTDKYKIVTINPLTGAVTYPYSAVVSPAPGTETANHPIGNETSAFGSIFSDANNNVFYIFANTLGNYYKIDIPNNTYTYISTSTTSSGNDGASNPHILLTASISGNVYDDGNGGNVDHYNSTGAPNSVPSTLYANLVDNATGKVTATSSVATVGTYSFSGIATGTYYVVLSTTNGTVGSTPPSASLPNGWVNTGAYNGPSGTGNSGATGTSATFNNTSTGASDINFGINSIPVAVAKSYTMTTQPSPNQIINLSNGGDASSGATPGNLTGSDLEDGSYTSAATTAYSVVISTLPTYGTLLYNGNPVTAGQTINNYDYSLLQFQFSGTGYTSTTFTYKVIDQAGQSSASAVSYIINIPYSLPVFYSKELAAALKGSSVNLTWATAQEINNKGFYILRSTDAVNFTKIDYLASLAFNGNSSTANSYSYVDHSPVSNSTNYYRLQQVDLDDNTAYSSIVSIATNTSADNVAIYPNPVLSTASVKGFKVGSVLNVVSLNGSTLLQTTVTSSSSQVIRLPNFVPGIYILQGYNLQNKPVSIKFEKQ